MQAETSNIDAAIREFHANFEAIYIEGTKRLLDEEGMFLAFLLMLTATEALAGVFAPHLGTGDRFKAFVARFYQAPLRDLGSELWGSRNLMVHSFNPGTFGLVCDQPHIHDTRNSVGINLDVGRVHGALAAAAASYFEELRADATLQEKFMRRLQEADGGALQVHTVVESWLDQ
jgi:hypothetical protein